MPCLAPPVFAAQEPPWRGAPRVTLIAAVAQDGTIGQGGALPWTLPEDLRFFRAQTLGHPILMGRKTFESIGRPLPGRRNLVMSHATNLSAEGVQFVASMADALSHCSSAPELFVIGGAAIYALALPFAARLLITHIERAYRGDTRFPEIPARFTETWREAHVAANDPSLAFAFVEYQALARTQST